MDLNSIFEVENMAKKRTVKGIDITVHDQNNRDFISLTDMLKAKVGDFFISDWLRNQNAVEFLGIWESVCNPHLNYGEFATIRSKAGLNNYKISVKEWQQKTNAITQMTSLMKNTQLRKLK